VSTAEISSTIAISRRMLHRTFAAPAFLLLMTGACARNRQSTVVSLPAPLVTALINDRGGATRGSPQFTVGSLPAGYPATLVPTGPVTIVGGMTAGNEIVAIFADSTRRLAAVLEQTFERAGFIRPAPRATQGFSSAGGPYSFFCNDSVMVSAEPLAGSVRNFARVSYRRVRVGTACPTVDPPPPEHQLALPALRPPVGVQVRGSHGGSGGDGVDSSAEITGPTLVPSVILAHYAAQLVAAGWTAAAPAVSERVAAQFFEVKDASGTRWEGVLMASGNVTTMTVSLSMHLRRQP
jgi:hypothetical protein